MWKILQILQQIAVVQRSTGGCDEEGEKESGNNLSADAKGRTLLGFFRLFDLYKSHKPLFGYMFGDIWYMYHTFSAPVLRLRVPTVLLDIPVGSR